MPCRLVDAHLIDKQRTNLRQEESVQEIATSRLCNPFSSHGFNGAKSPIRTLFIGIPIRLFGTLLQSMYTTALSALRRPALYCIIGSFTTGSSDTYMLCVHIRYLEASVYSSSETKVHVVHVLM